MDSIIKNDIVVRRLRVEDADDISEIYGLITTKSQNATLLNKAVKENVIKEDHEADFVSEIDGKVVGFF